MVRFSAIIFAALVAAVSAAAVDEPAVALETRALKTESHDQKVDVKGHVDAKQIFPYGGGGFNSFTSITSVQSFATFLSASFIPMCNNFIGALGPGLSPSYLLFKVTRIVTKLIWAITQLQQLSCAPCGAQALLPLLQTRIIMLLTKLQLIITTLQSLYTTLFPQIIIIMQQLQGPLAWFMTFCTQINLWQGANFGLLAVNIFQPVLPIVATTIGQVCNTCGAGPFFKK